MKATIVMPPRDHDWYRRFCTWIAGVALAFVAVPAFAADLYDARIAGREILTPKPKDVPKINGPTVCGARPDKPFVFRVPTTGRRPMTFSAKNLPPTLKLDRARGIITGRTPATSAIRNSSSAGLA